MLELEHQHSAGASARNSAALLLLVCYCAGQHAAAIYWRRHEPLKIPAAMDNVQPILVGHTDHAGHKDIPAEVHDQKVSTAHKGCCLSN